MSMVYMRVVAAHFVFFDNRIDFYVEGIQASLIVIFLPKRLIFADNLRSQYARNWDFVSNLNLINDLSS